jgi:CheY-like chemotaxis protein
MSRDEPSILVVDDDPDNCRNLADILEDLGYRVDTAQSGPDAIELARRTSYDIALLDLRMPGMDGLELYRELKRIRPGAVALLVTAYSGGGKAEEALTAGMWKVVTKPVDLAKLLPLVDEALGQPLILVVDDDHDLCANLGEMFRERGFRVAVAHTLEEAEARIREEGFRVVLIDMMLPGADGGAVFRAVREARPEARTVLVTGARERFADLIEQALAEGADAVCYKPFDIPQLLSTLDRLAGSSGAG